MLTLSITDPRPWPEQLGPRVAGAATQARPSASLARFIASAHRWYRLRRDARRLMAFDDRMLRDIGLGRGGIAHAVDAGRVLGPSTASAASAPTSGSPQARARRAAAWPIVEAP